MPDLEPKKKDQALLDATKPPADLKKPAAGATNPLKAMSLDAQRARLAPPDPAAGLATAVAAPKKDVVSGEKEAPTQYEQVVAILAKNKLPACLVPTNVKSFEYQVGSGQLILNLTAGFTKEIIDEKGKANQVKFEQRILMSTWSGRLTNIQGITVPSSHGARLTDIEAPGNGFLRLTGRMGLFSKTLELRESDFPALP